jgi:hypothetical protein
MGTTNRRADNPELLALLLADELVEGETWPVAVRGPIARRAARSGASVATWYTHAIRSSALARPVRIRSPAARQAQHMSARQSPESRAGPPLTTDRAGPSALSSEHTPRALDTTGLARLP